MTTLTFTHLDRDVIVVQGPEAAGYLHGQISQDVESMAVGETTMSLLLEPRGRLEGVFRITRSTDDTFVLDTDPGAGPELRASLERFKLRTKAEFSEPGWAMLALRGDGALAASSESGGLAIPALWSEGEAIDVLGAELTVPAGARELPIAAYDEQRVARGLPTMGRDVLDGDIPNETDLLDVAVSFSKGCYRGQELVERIDSRAGGRRMLRRFSSSGDLSEGDDLSSDGATVGTIRSSYAGGAGTVGFALVRADAETASAGDDDVELSPLFPAG